MGFLENINESDFIDLENSVHELIYNELTDDIMLYNSKKFYDKLTHNISDYYLDLWKDAGLCDDDDKEELDKFIWNFVWSFFHIYQEFPRREYCVVNDVPNNEDISNKL